jgi:hypothetical protein
VLVEAEWKGPSGVHTALTNVLFWSHPPRLRSAPSEGRYLVGDKWRVADLNRTAEPLQFAAATRKILHTFSSLDRLRSPARLAGVRLRFITRSEKLLGDSIASRISIAVELAAEPSFVRQLSTACLEKSYSYYCGLSAKQGRNDRMGADRPIASEGTLVVLYYKKLHTSQSVRAGTVILWSDSGIN